MPANTGLSEKTEIRLKQPKQYKVVMYNDDFTPMDVVVEILIDVFRKNYEEAVAIMMTVHKGQKAVVGVYSYDIAKTKAARAVTFTCWRKRSRLSSRCWTARVR